MQLDLTYGLCQCGCGQRTAIHKYTFKARGWVKGEPARFVLGHRNQYPTMGLPVLQRFAAHYVVEPRGYESDCWIWQSAKSSNGYGSFHVREGASQITRAAHRWRWEQEHGPVPEGLQLDHPVPESSLRSSRPPRARDGSRELAAWPCPKADTRAG